MRSVRERNFRKNLSRLQLLKELPRQTMTVSPNIQPADGLKRQVIPRRKGEEHLWRWNTGSLEGGTHGLGAASRPKQRMAQLKERLKVLFKLKRNNVQIIAAKVPLFTSFPLRKHNENQTDLICSVNRKNNSRNSPCHMWHVFVWFSAEVCILCQHNNSVLLWLHWRHCRCCPGWNCTMLSYSFRKATQIHRDLSTLLYCSRPCLLRNWRQTAHCWFKCQRTRNPWPFQGAQS